MWRKQVAVVAGMASAAAALAVLWLRGPHELGIAVPAGDDGAARLVFLAKWLFVPALSLLAGIGSVSALRFFSAQAIDGTRAPSSRFLELTLRYNQNTLEQLVLATIAWLGLAVAVPHDRLGLIPVLAVLFVIARLLFVVGYLIAPPARALGYVLTFAPTLAAYSWLAGNALRPAG